VDVVASLVVVGSLARKRPMVRLVVPVGIERPSVSEPLGVTCWAAGRHGRWLGP